MGFCREPELCNGGKPRRNRRIVRIGVLVADGGKLGKRHIVRLPLHSTVWSGSIPPNDDLSLCSRIAIVLIELYERRLSPCLYGGVACSIRCKRESNTVTAHAPCSIGIHTRTYFQALLRIPHDQKIRVRTELPSGNSIAG